MYRFSLGHLESRNSWFFEGFKFDRGFIWRSSSEAIGEFDAVLLAGKGGLRPVFRILEMSKSCTPFLLWPPYMKATSLLDL